MAIYIPTTWIDDQAPARSATNLNKQEAGILANSTFVHTLTTRGDLLYRNAVNASARLPVGTAGQWLKSDGVDIGWADLTAIEDADFTTEGVMYRGTTSGTYSVKTIGSDIQAYDIDTAKTDVAQSFTAAQRVTFITTEDNSIAFNTGNNLSFTATAANITVTNQTAGQSGTLVIASANLITGWGTQFNWGNAGVPTDLTGTEKFGYTITLASGVDSIVISRV